MKTTIGAAVGAVLVLSALPVSGQLYRPSEKYRSLNTALYEIAIQKNGRLDVTFVDGDPVFTNVFPMVWFADEEEPELLPVDGRFSGRYAVDDALGRGQGMVIARKSVEWAVRSYPTQPFFAVQVAYRNMGKKPVQIRALYPFCVGEPKDGAIGLGPGSAEALLYEHSRFWLTGDAGGAVTTGAAQSDWHVAAFNPTTARSLAIGFLTANRAFGSIDLRGGEGKKADPDNLRYLRAACVFDPPVTVGPEESLLSEVLYISLAESDPYMTMERYARAVAVVNGVPAPQPPPLGWDLRGKSAAEIRTFASSDAARALQAQGWRTLWVDFKGAAIPNGWQWKGQDFGADPVAFVQEMVGLGYKFAATVRPFTAGADDLLRGTKPDWFVPAGMAPGAGFVLNATLPEVREHLQAVGAAWRSEFGLHAVLLADTADLASVAPVDPAGGSRLQTYRAALEALRAGFGGEGQWMAGAEPAFMSSLLLDGYVPEAPWSSSARNYYLTPQLGAPYLFLDEGQSDQDAVSQLMTASLMNAGMAALPAYAHSPAVRDVMLRILAGTAESYFRPGEWASERPEVWFGPYPSAGATRVLALTGAAGGGEVWLPFTQAGFAPSSYVSVFDLHHREYKGTARGGVTVATHPGQTHLLALQPVVERPVLLHREPPLLPIAESAAAEWDVASGVLRGSFEGIAGVAYTLHFLMPENAQFQSLRANGIGEPQVTTRGRAVSVVVLAAVSGPLHWSAQFSQ